MARIATNRSQSRDVPLSPAALDALMREVMAAARSRSEARKQSSRAYEFRANNLVAQTDTSSELVLVGAAGTGKTLANLVYINRMMWTYPNLRVLIIRKVRADLAESALVTYERDVLGYDNPICAGARRDTRHAYHYPNGSVMVIAGMDRPGKALSTEWDIVYAPECNQLELNDWETLGMRLGRTSGFPHPQMRGDTNPDRPDHWLLDRVNAGKLKMVTTYHQDNPAYHDGADWTALGRAYLQRLEGLSGIRRARYLLGQWVQAEGAVYDIWDEAVHVWDDQSLMEAGWLVERDGRMAPGARVVRVIGGQDWGFTNPGVLQVWLLDGDGRMLLAHEVYMTRQLTGWWVAQAQAAMSWWGMETLACDPSQPAAIGEMVAGGIHAVPAINDIRDGIDRVYARLVVQADGLPRLMVRRNALDMRDPNREEKLQPCGLREEISGQVWKDKSRREEPADGENHASDVVRYSAQEADMNRRIEVMQDNPLFW